MNTIPNIDRVHRWQLRYLDTGRTVDVRRHIQQTGRGLVWPVIKRNDGQLLIKGERFD